MIFVTFVVFSVSGGRGGGGGFEGGLAPRYVDDQLFQVVHEVAIAQLRV